MANNTIFDDVFRTLLEKMPELAVPLINEVFGTSYPEDIQLIQKMKSYRKNCSFFFLFILCGMKRRL